MAVSVLKKLVQFRQVHLEVVAKPVLLRQLHDEVAIPRELHHEVKTKLIALLQLCHVTRLPLLLRQFANGAMQHLLEHHRLVPQIVLSYHRLRSVPRVTAVHPQSPELFVNQEMGIAFSTHWLMDWAVAMQLHCGLRSVCSWRITETCPSQVFPWVSGLRWCQVSP